MGQLDDVLAQLRRELDGESAVSDVEAAVDAMARAFRHVTSDADWLSGSAVARMLGVSRQAVNQRAARGSLLAVADHEGVRYPRWQFRDGSPVPGLMDLVRTARDSGVDDAALAAWIERDDDRLELVACGSAVGLAASVHEARRARTSVTRRRVTRRAPKLSDSSVA